MTYEQLRARLLMAGNFSPESSMNLDEIIVAIGRDGHSQYLMTGLAFELAGFIELQRKAPGAA